MKKLIACIKRAALMFKIRSLETVIDGQSDALDVIKDPTVRLHIFTSREIARKELAVLRSEYCATLPAGQRIIWGAA